MPDKQYLKWIQLREWCIQNPGKLAAIVTPMGTFEVKFKPEEKKDKSKYKTRDFD